MAELFTVVSSLDVEVAKHNTDKIAFMGTMEWDLSAKKITGDSY